MADAPGWIDEGAGEDRFNQSSNWPDTVPEDWSFLAAGPEPTPGKRVRIVNTESMPEIARGERLAVRAFNLSAEPMTDGGIRFTWELEAAHGADVRVSVNMAGPVSKSRSLATSSSSAASYYFRLPSRHAPGCIATPRGYRSGLRVRAASKQALA